MLTWKMKIRKKTWKEITRCFKGGKEKKKTYKKIIIIKIGEKKSIIRCLCGKRKKEEGKLKIK
jgi:hypothetical protein